MQLLAIVVVCCDPEAWLRDVLTRITDGHPANRISELAPWN